MRKHFLGLMWMVVLVLFLSGFLLAGVQHPAPFQKAKEMALKCPKNENGDHVWTTTLNKEGVLIRYEIIYGTFRNETGEHDVVLLIKRQGSAWLAIGHCGICDDYKVASNQTGRFVNIEKDLAIQTAFEFFKELVKETLI